MLKKTRDELSIAIYKAEESAVDRAHKDAYRLVQRVWKGLEDQATSSLAIAHSEEATRKHTKEVATKLDGFETIALQCNKLLCEGLKALTERVERIEERETSSGSALMDDLDSIGRCIKEHLGVNPFQPVDEKPSIADPPKQLTLDDLIAMNNTLITLNQNQLNTIFKLEQANELLVERNENQAKTISMYHKQVGKLAVDE